MADRDEGRARLILITGEPGSGKTTLGTALAGALRVPFLARDDVRGGLFLTLGSWGHRPGSVPAAEAATGTFLDLATVLAERGVSCVVEYVVRRDRPEDLARLEAVADCVVVRTTCTEAPRRVARRAAHDRLLNRPGVLEVLGFASIEDHTSDAAERMRAVTAAMRTTFELPTLTVRTDDGYEPELDRIIEFVVGPSSASPTSGPASMS